VSYSRENLLSELGVSRETGARLARHLELLRAWSGRMNLVGPHELDDYWRRHALDSAQLVRHAAGAVRWIDLGSGAGFPGLVVACCLAGQEGADITLVEANHRKAAFLREAIRATGAPARVQAERIEITAPYPLAAAVRRREVGRGPGAGGATYAYQVVTARAFAPLWRIIEHAKPILDHGGLGLFLKGEDVEAELAEARKRWELQVEILPSLSDPRGRIVRVEGARLVGPQP
jgi:16S rRNA (guanine527-N7)-methyltransferase